MMPRSRGKKRRGGGSRRGKTRRGGRSRFRGSRRVGAGRRRRRVGGGARQGSRKFKAAIRKLRKMSPGVQVQAIRAANNKFIRCMCRAVRTLKNKPLPPKLTTHMHRNSKKIRKLINPKTNMSVKRNMLSRRTGGFLPLLLAALSVGGPIISGILGRRADN